MINIFRRKRAHSIRYQQGAATLVITVILITAALLILIYATSHSMLQQKSSSNIYYKKQSYTAAEAGLEFAIINLKTNSTTILANPSGGFINYTVGPTTLANNSSYSVTYTNPTANNYNTLLITAVGNNSDGTSTSTLRQLVSKTPPSLYTVTNQGNVEVRGAGGTITGTYAIRSAGNVDPSAAAAGGQIIANDDTLDDTDLFLSIFGVSQSVKKSQSTVYTNSGSIPWNNLNGSIWVEDNISISGQTTGGSAANPITLIVTGNYTAAGQATIHGIVYVMGNVDLRGNALINGAVITQGNLILRGNGGVNYNANIISNVLGGSTGQSEYVKVPGSWRDF